jgi:hypothetical protein
MRYQAPAGQTGINIGGEQFDADDRGIITVPDGGDFTALLLPHGFTPCPAQPGGPDTVLQPTTGD